jgi:U3 small nucleolar RNA-associated protein 13
MSVIYCAVSKDESLLISGGCDSNLVLWRDVTDKCREEAEEARQKLVLQEQELANLVKSDQLLSALKLALSLDRPLQVLRIIQGELCC